MAVPKKKTSKSKRSTRRSHDKIKLVNISYNAETGEPQLSHQISIDGYYGNRQVIKPKEKKSDNNAEDSKNESEVAKELTKNEISENKTVEKKSEEKNDNIKLEKNKEDKNSK